MHVRWIPVVVLSMLFLLSGTQTLFGRTPLRMARLQYGGGGDWYNDPDVIPNLLKFVRNETGIPVEARQFVVRIGEESMFDYPVLYLTGHGNIRFSEQEAQSLRRYLLAGGFLYADDDYGMDSSFRREIGKVFPDRPLEKLSPSHPLLKSFFHFERVPRIHEHDPNQPPEAFGVRVDEEWVLLYTFNTNISDGWASPKVHNDPPETRRTALRFGTNILFWILSP